MGGSPNVMGMVNDPEFQGYSPADKRLALYKLTGDESFRNLKDSETLQFVSRLSGKSSETQQFSAGLPQPEAPVPQMPFFNPPKPGGALPTMGQYGYAEQTPAAAKVLGGSAAVGSGAAQVLGAPAATVGAMVGGAGGAPVGGRVGRYIGKFIGEPDTGEKVGAVAGGLFGSVAGGVTGAEVSSVRGAIRQILTKKLGLETPVSAVEAQAPAEAQDLISRMRKLVVPGEEPTLADLKRAGDLTQAPLSKLQALAKFGDRLAQNELNRRLRIGAQ